MKQINYANNNFLNELNDFFNKKIDGDFLNSINDFLNREINRLKELGVDFSKNDYYKNKEFRKNNSYIPLLLIPVNLTIEKCVIGQKRLEEIYGSYDLIITRKLTKKEREINEWCTVLYCKISYVEKDLNQYFYRPEKGLVARLKDLGFDIDAFDKSKYIDEKIRLLFFLGSFEIIENIKLKSFLGNPTLENVGNILCDEKTRNGELTKKLKFGLLRGISPCFVIEARDTVRSLIINWENVIVKILKLVDYSYRKTQLKKLQQINLIMNIFMKEYDIESLFYSEYKHSLLETFYLKLIQHENVGRENDILDIEEFIRENKEDIIINNAEKYIHLQKEIIEREQIKELIKENKNELAQFIFEKEQIEKNELRRLNYILKDIDKYLDILFENTFFKENKKLTKLFVYICVKEIVSLTNEDKIDNFFYKYKTSDQRSLKAELKAKNNTFKKNQLMLIQKLFKRYNAYIGTQNEWYVSQLILYKIDYIIKEIVSRNNIKDMYNLNNIFSILMKAALIDESNVLRCKKAFENLIKSLIGNDYVIEGEEYKIHMFFAVLENIKNLNSLLLTLREDINNGINIKNKNYLVEIENVLIDEKLKANINITINAITQKTRVEDFKFIF